MVHCLLDNLYKEIFLIDIKIPRIYWLGNIPSLKISTANSKIMTDYAVAPTFKIIGLEYATRLDMVAQI